MKQIITTFGLLILSIVLYAQVPQGINYQAIARGDDGKPLANKNIKIEFEILKGSETGDVVFKEEHDVTTNKYGLFTLKIGQGNVSNGDFGTIDWKDGNWIAVNINGNHRVVNPLLTVPYSYMAQEVLNDKVNDADADSLNELQELKIVGDTIFISGKNYVTLPKLSLVFEKNGNDIRTIGGYGSTNFIFGSPTMDYDWDTLHASRMFFDKQKAAFRVGYSRYSGWGNNFLGKYSFAAGRSTIASGRESTAFGHGAIASGEASFASGHTARAIGNYSTTMGQFTIAYGSNSTALGSNTTANAINSISMGGYTKANGYSSLVAGSYNDTLVPIEDNLSDTTPLFIVGNGIDDTARSNAFSVLKNGKVTINQEYTLPTTDGQANQVMATNGNDSLYWKDANTGSNTNNHGIWISDSNRVYLKYYDNDIDFVFGADSVNDNAAVITDNSKMMFVKSHAAFRVGYAAGKFWDKDSLGAFSFAAGLGNTAKGYASSIAGGAGNIAHDSLTFIGGGIANQANATGGTITGGFNNIVNGRYAGIHSGENNKAEGRDAFVGGGNTNIASGIASTIAGGTANKAKDDGTTIAGGIFNEAKGVGTTIAGGYNNKTETDYAFIGGGLNHRTAGAVNVIVGGKNNYTRDSLSAIVGGSRNAADRSGFVGGGNQNQAGQYAAVAGGDSNLAYGKYSSIIGGTHLSAPSYGEVALGYYNTNYTALGKDSFNFQDRLFSIGGGTPSIPYDIMTINKEGITQFNGQINNLVYNFGTSSTDTLIYPQTVPGPGNWAMTYDGSQKLTWSEIKNEGGAFKSDSINVSLRHINDSIGFVVGGGSVGGSPSLTFDDVRMGFSKRKAAFRVGIDTSGSWVSDSLGYGSFAAGANNAVLANYSSITGGELNRIEEEGKYNFIGGGGKNNVGVYNTHSGIVSGEENKVDGYASFIGSGFNNFVESEQGAIAGGASNSINQADLGFIGAGFGNSIQEGSRAVICGGLDNATYNENSAILGGSENTTRGVSSSVAGGVGLIAQSYAETAIGAYNDTITAANLKSKDTLNSSDRVFVVGNGKYTNRSNAFIVTKDGKAWLAGSLTQNSDARLKTDIKPINNALENIKKIEGVTYHWNSLTPKDTATLQMGVIAQQIETVYPHLVRKEGEYKSVNYISLIPVLIEAIKELEAENVVLKSSNSTYKTDLEAQKTRMDNLEAMLNTLIKNQ